METSDEYRFAENVAIHGVNDVVTKIDHGLSICSGGRLSDIELGVERVELEGEVMIRSGPRSGTQVTGAAQADLTRSIRQFTLSDAFRQTRGRAGDVPHQ